MIRIPAAPLTAFATAVFAAAGSRAGEATDIAEHLVEANLRGHDSHGVIRITKYIDWLEAGEVIANAVPRTVIDHGALLVIDGGFGYGQSIGRVAMRQAAERCRAHGMAIVALRNCGHLGRIGAWAEQLAHEGLVSIHFVNTSGYGILVAPHGGSDRRLSANPIAAGAPGPNGVPIVLDIATSATAEGKLQIARNKGESVAAGLIIDGAGRPTTDPEAFYADPPGAILPFGAHKGAGLSLFCEILAGALSGGETSHPQSATAHRLVNNMLTIALAPAAFGQADAFGPDIARLATWVTASPPISAESEILLPGAIEERTRAERIAGGIPLDEETFRRICATAAKFAIAAPPPLEAAA